MKKERVDILLVERGFFPSRERAQSALMAGMVMVNEQKVDKPGSKITLDADIRIIGEQLPYVSRGGLKLEKALKEFSIDLTGKIMADFGASTGGFTDCALQNGAKKVYAVDVGYGQLAWRLRQDERVVNIERTNARYLTDGQITEKLDFASMDLSFISLDKVLPKIKCFLHDDAEIVALVKPQFEAGREKIGKKGVVRDKNVHEDVIKKVITMAEENGFFVKGLDYSPIKGPEGNIEYLLYLSLTGNDNDIDIKNIVDKAHLM